jgi:cellulose synthase/poly-beta-1,6-N-acetylglucosamine synthase-like glycosyltransferase
MMISCIITICGKVSGNDSLVNIVTQLKNQTYKDIEIIPLVCCMENLPYIQNLLNIKIHEFLHENHTQNEKINIALKMELQGKYLGFFAGDDKYSIDFLEKMVNCVESENAYLVYCNFRSHYNQNDKVDGSTEHGHIGMGSLIVRSDIAKEVGSMEVSGKGDYEFVQRVKEKGVKIVKVNEMLYTHN